MKCPLVISNFLEEISGLSHSIVFLFFIALITEEGFLSFLPILWNSAFRWVYLSYSPLPFTSLLSSAICKASSDNHFAFLHFFFLGMILITASYAMSWTSVHSSSSTLSYLIPWIYLSLPLYNHQRRQWQPTPVLLPGESHGQRVHNIVQEVMIKTIPTKRKCKMVVWGGLTNSWGKKRS